MCDETKKCNAYMYTNKESKNIPKRGLCQLIHVDWDSEGIKYRKKKSVDIFTKIQYDYVNSVSVDPPTGTALSDLSKTDGLLSLRQNSSDEEITPELFGAACFETMILGLVLLFVYMLSKKCMRKRKNQ